MALTHSLDKQSEKELGFEVEKLPDGQVRLTAKNQWTNNSRKILWTGSPPCESRIKKTKEEYFTKILYQSKTDKSRRDSLNNQSNADFVDMMIDETESTH